MGKNEAPPRRKPGPWFAVFACVFLAALVTVWYGSEAGWFMNKKTKALLDEGDRLIDTIEQRHQAQDK